MRSPNFPAAIGVRTSKGREGRGRSGVQCGGGERRRPTCKGKEGRGLLLRGTEGSESMREWQKLRGKECPKVKVSRNENCVNTNLITL